MRIQLGKGHNYWILINPATQAVACNLNVSNPGPVDLPFEAMHPGCQAQIKKSLQYGTIFLVPDEVVETPADKVEAPEADTPAGLLQLSIAACKEKLVVLIKDNNIDFLTEMYQLENAAFTPRKGMLENIRDALNQCGGISSVIDSDTEEVVITFDTVAE